MFTWLKTLFKPKNANGVQDEPKSVEEIASTTDPAPAELINATQVKTEPVVAKPKPTSQPKKKAPAKPVAPKKAPAKKPQK